MLISVFWGSYEIYPKSGKACWFWGDVRRFCTPISIAFSCEDQISFTWYTLLLPRHKCGFSNVTCKTVIPSMGSNVVSRLVSFHSHPPPDGSVYFCQHPGSPGWPQQPCRFFILMALFRRKSEILSLSGIGPDKLVKKSLTLGRLFLSPCSSMLFSIIA